MGINWVIKFGETKKKNTYKKKKKKWRGGGRVSRKNTTSFYCFSSALLSLAVRSSGTWTWTHRYALHLSRRGDDLLVDLRGGLHNSGLSCSCCHLGGQLGDNSCLLRGLLLLLLLVHGHGSDHLLDLLHLSQLLDHCLRGLELHDLGLASLRQVLGTVRSTSTITTPHWTEPSEHHTTCGPSGYHAIQKPAGHQPAWEPSGHHPTWEQIRLPPHMGTIRSPPYMGTIRSPPCTGTIRSPPYMGTITSPPHRGTIKSPHYMGTIRSPHYMGTIRTPHSMGTIRSPPYMGTIRSRPTWEPPGHHHTGEPSWVTPALNYQTRPELSSKLRHHIVLHSSESSNREGLPKRKAIILCMLNTVSVPSIHLLLRSLQ